MTFLKFNLPFSYTHIEIILKNTEQLLCARQQSPCLSEASVTGVEEGGGAFAQEEGWGQEVGGTWASMSANWTSLGQ